jgi:PAS domain S-box-containing protein
MTEDRGRTTEPPVVHCILHDGVITFVSSTLLELSGLPPERFHGRRAIDLVHPDDCDALQRFREPGWEGIIDASFRVEDASGAWIWLRAEGVRTIDDDGSTSAILTLRQIDDPGASP